MRDLNLSLLSRTSLVASAVAGRAFLGHLEALHPGWMPARWGHYEPLRHRHEQGGPTDEMWGAHLFWKARDKATGDASVHYGPEQPHAYLAIDADSARVDIPGAIALLKRLAAEFGGDYGYLHKVTREDEAFLQGTKTAADFDDEDGSDLVVPTAQLKLCLPDLFWANVLGPPYTQMFGAERLATAPAHLVEEIAPGTFYLQLSERIEDIHEHPEQLDRARVEIEKHLGPNAFWHPDNPPDHPYQAPHFPTRDPRPEPGSGG